MKQITLEAKSREGLGRTASRQLRASGGVPAVFYGESGVRHLTVDAHTFQMVWREIMGRATLIEIKAEGDTDSHFAIIQEAQRDSRTEAFLHIDFKEVVRGKDMEAEVPLVTRGTPHGVRNYGGVLEINLDTIRVRCRPRNLPEYILLDVAALEIGRSVHLNEISPPEGVEFLDDPDLVVVTCSGASSGASTAVDEAAEEEAEAEAAEKEANAAATVDSKTESKG